MVKRFHLLAAAFGLTLMLVGAVTTLITLAQDGGQGISIPVQQIGSLPITQFIRQEPGIQVHLTLPDGQVQQVSAAGLAFDQFLSPLAPGAYLVALVMPSGDTLYFNFTMLEGQNLIVPPEWINGIPYAPPVPTDIPYVPPPPPIIEPTQVPVEVIVLPTQPPVVEAQPTLQVSEATPEVIIATVETQPTQEIAVPTTEMTVEVITAPVEATAEPTSAPGDMTPVPADIVVKVISVPADIPPAVEATVDVMTPIIEIQPTAVAAITTDPTKGVDVQATVPPEDSAVPESTADPLKPEPTTSPLAEETEAAVSPGTTGLGQVSGQVLPVQPGREIGVQLNITRLGDEIAPASAVAVNADGTFVVADLLPGSYRLEASAPGFLSAAAELTLSGDSLIELPAVTLTPGDTNRDNLIDIRDVALVAANFDSPALVAEADLNGDGWIDVRDLSLIGAQFGSSGPLPWAGVSLTIR